MIYLEEKGGIKINVFELEAKIGLDDSEYNSKLGKAGNTMGTMAKKIGNGLKTVAKVGVAAVAAGATALAALSKASIEQYAEYEQLSGGVQKIFDEMDNTVIFKDAQNAWKELNMSANDYLSTIVDVGANFASTMGDQKGYETARRGFLAISDYASGTGKNVDELAQKFTMITRSASSYQSIADQFSGILPATSKDFLEQAQAAGYLSDKYKNLTEVPIAEYQETVALMLEKGVAALNLTGNTARETETTISGSLFAMKAAWYNLTTGFADGSQDINQLLDNFVYSVENVGKNVIPIIKEMLPRLIDGFGYLADELGPELGGILEEILPDLIEGAENLISKFIEKAPELIDEILPSLISGAAKLITDLIDNLPEIVSEFGSSVKKSLVDSLNEAGLEDAAESVEDVFTIIEEVVPRAADAVEGAFEKIGAAFEGIQPAISWLADNIGPVMDFLEGSLQILIPTLNDFDEQLANGEVQIASFADRQEYANKQIEEGASKFTAYLNAFGLASDERILTEIGVIGEIGTTAEESSGKLDVAAESVRNFNTETSKTGSGFDTELSGMSESAQDFANTLGESLLQSAAGFTDLDSTASKTWSDMIVSMGEQWATFTTGMATAFQQFSETITTSDMWSSFATNMASLEESARTTSDNVVSAVENMVAKCKAAMNFSWNLPYLAMPHISVTGKFDIQNGTAPSFSVSWYRKAMDNAMILNGATIFGAMNGQFLGGGEAGKEVVSGADTLMNMIEEAVRKVVHGKNTSGIQIVQNIQSVPQTPVELAALTQSYFEQARWAI